MSDIPRNHPTAQEPPLRGGWRWYALLMFTLVALCHGWAYARAAPPQAGAGMLLLGLPGQYRPATRVATEVDIQVHGLIAQARVRQSFRNDGDGWTEGVYLFPLPENAAVNRMRLIVGERIIDGEVQERAQAKAAYATAKAAGQRTALVEQERPNLFTTSVANVGPGEEVRVEIHYQQTLRYEAGEFRLRFPMTFTPRYIPGVPGEQVLAEQRYAPGAAGWAAPTPAVPDAHRVTPPIQHPAAGSVNPTRLVVELRPGFELARLESRYHPVRSREEGGVRRVELATEASDRDFELVWAPAPQAAPVAAAFKQTVDGEHYALLMLMPPQAAPRRLPRELIFVIDTSGSMGGTSIAQARAALGLALDRLAPTDRFNVIQFNSYTHQLFPAPVAADARALARARGYVAGLEANNGTEMAPALRAALDAPAAEGWLKQVVFITDGAVGNEEQLFALIEQRLGDARLFPVGIGSAPNAHFMTKAAQFGRGSYTFIGDLGEVRARMGELFAKLESPVLRDLCLRWPAGAEMYPRRVPDLYAGEPLLVAARLAAPGGEVEVCGETGGQPWVRRLGLQGAEANGIAGVWARRKIAELLDARRGGEEPEAIRRQVLEVALRHQLVSPYTSFVAVDRTPARHSNDALMLEALPHALPAGSDPAGFGLPLPQTATPAPLLWLLGLASLAAGLWLRRRS